MTPASVARRHERTGWTRRRVGNFFHHVVAKIVEGRITDHYNTVLGDVINSHLKLSVEVKGGSNHDAFLVPINQLERYLSRAHKRNYTYCFCGYKGNTRRKKGDDLPRGVKHSTYSALARIEKRSDQYKFFSERLNEVYLLDLELVHAIQPLCALAKKREGREESDKFKVGRRLLRRHFRDGALDDNLMELGVLPGDFVRGKYELDLHFTIEDTPLYSDAEFTQCRARFDLFTVLRPEMHARVKDIIENPLPF